MESICTIYNVSRISISQRNRWYYWKVKELFISREKIEHNSANVHIVHANKQILSVIKKAKKGDIIKMKGSLIKANELNGNWKWKSSASRKDTGSGACEVFYVTTAYIKK